MSACLQPPLVLVNGEWKRFSCRRCSNCIKGRKSDYVGRMLLETDLADATFFVTLTLAPGENGATEFVTKDVQLFMKRLRQRYARQSARAGFRGEKIQTPPRAAPKRSKGVSKRALMDRARKDRFIGPPKPRYRGARVRFMRSGERGTKGTMRCHHHLMLWCEGPKPDWERSKRTHAGERWDLWPHGWSDVSFVPADQGVQRANYVAKYCVKSAFDERPAVGFSSRPALGTAGLEIRARQHAEAGVPLREIYRVANVKMTRGPNRGQLREFRMSGRARDHAFKAYRKRFHEIYGPDATVPETEWSLKYDDEAIFAVPAAMPRMQWHKREKTLPKIGRGQKAGTLMVLNANGKTVGALMINRRGVARFSYSERSEVYGNEIVRRDLRGLVDLPEAVHERVAEWLKEHRGPQWVDHDDYVAERRRIRDALEQRLQDAAWQGAAAIHDPAYFKRLDVLRTMDAAIWASVYVRNQKLGDLSISADEYIRRRNLRPFTVEPVPRAASP